MSRQDDLPPAIMEAAIRWSVTLASGTADAGHRRDYQRWLEADERHRRAAERLAAIDDEVRGARRAGHGATDTLDHLQRGRRRPHQANPQKTALTAKGQDHQKRKKNARAI